PVQAVVSRLGSAALNDPDVLRAVLDELKRRDLPFIDSHPSGPSMVEEIGEETGARTLTVGGSLDDDRGTAASVRARIREYAAAAVQHGSLVVMVRPSALVLDVLESELPRIRAQGVELVPISRVAL
ncbi:MAG TPA: divergent polysaccharide deacetylase family protein, partial [Candidatus Limnocylindrales bacterium]|nr:divergent polysaccharide deacetylase family protein [Candidatus Limnocylindrales bacterium]